VSLADDPTIVPRPSPLPSDSDTVTDAIGLRTDDVPLPRGAEVGRYLVLEELGAGAMGRVYAAYDPRLDRKVALKLIRDQLGVGSRAERGAARLLAEAQALARLAHPNVVGVHDVAIVDGSVAIAMEFVAGTSAREWLRTPRPWREVVRVLLDAGAGLAAAHRAGIIHSDFKPDNIMIGHDGRARVVDFGLARSDGGAGESSTEWNTATDPSQAQAQAQAQATATATATAAATAIVASITHGIAGTPAYMAPEIFAGAAASVRSDQFAFCVTLYEALYGHRPYPGDTPASLLDHVIRGDILTPESSAEVPGWLHRHVVSGLDANATRRHADMDALLGALADDPAQRRRRIAIGAAALACVGVAIGSTWHLARADDPCPTIDTEQGSSWNEQTRGQIAAALDDTGVAWASRARVEVDHRLGGFALALATMRRDSCLATHVRHEQSDAMLDRRAACMAARERELAAVTEVFAHADADVARESVRILDGLGSVEACADLEALAEAVAPPTDPDLRADVEALRSELTGIDVTTRAGKYADAHTRAAAASAAAERLAYPPLVAEAKHALGYLEDKIGDSAAAEHTLAAAAQIAAESRHDLVAAMALADAVFVIGAQLGRVDEALIWARFADAAAARTGDDRLRAKALTVRGTVLMTAGRFAASEAALREGLALRLALFGERSLDVSISLASLAVAVEGQGRDAEAIELYERAQGIDEALLGPEHPRVAGGLNNAVTSLLRLGRVDEAIAHARRADAIFRAALPVLHPNRAAALGNLAVALGAAGDYEAARETLARQLEMLRSRFGDAHPDVATAHHNLGAAEYELGNDAAATEHFTRAIAIYAAAFGPDHPEIAGAHSALGHLAQRAGRQAQAREAFLRAVAILEPEELQSRVELPIALVGLSDSTLALGDHRAAEAAARRAIDLFQRQPQWADRLSAATWLLARIHRAAGDDATARTLADAAVRLCPGGDVACSDYAAATSDQFGHRAPG